MHVTDLLLDFCVSCLLEHAWCFMKRVENIWKPLNTLENQLCATHWRNKINIRNENTDIYMFQSHPTAKTSICQCPCGWLSCWRPEVWWGMYVYKMHDGKSPAGKGIHIWPVCHGLEFMSVRVCAATVHQISSNQISDNGRLNLSGKSCFRPSTSSWTQPVQIFWDRLLCLLSLCHRETSCQVCVPKRLSWAFLQRLSSCSLLRHVVQPSPSASWCISEPWPSKKSCSSGEFLWATALPNYPCRWDTSPCWVAKWPPSISPAWIAKNSWAVPWPQGPLGDSRPSEAKTWPCWPESDCSVSHNEDQCPPPSCLPQYNVKRHKDCLWNVWSLSCKQYQSNPIRNMNWPIP